MSNDTHINDPEQRLIRYSRIRVAFAKREEI